jgi:hypothetical protein
VLHTALSSALDIIAAVPDPGSGTKPPGADGVDTILAWAAWMAFAICVLGVIIAGATMAIQHRRGEGGESMARLGWVFGGCIVIGSASALVGALV